MPVLYYLACGTCFFSIFFLLFRNYISGALPGADFWIFIFTAVPLILLLFAVTVASFFAVCLLVQTFGKRHARVQLLSILLLPACICLPYYLGIPSFLDGMERRFRNAGVSDEWVSIAANESKMPREGGSPVEIEDYARREKIITSHPFDALSVESIPRIIARDSSLIFRFGGFLSPRWGFSISGVEGKEPSMPSDSFDKRQISTEVVVFNIPND
ncbi:MAG: hypothetical protein EOP88_04345 [Verrucomicrobiaceae bacterium]|nr:MAG: hypothetical protein EOP88_04345 [Verrucomicrobiaceae bacterium]